MPITEQLRSALADRYVIDRLIGEGGMATVYLARDIRHNRKVALKVLRPDLGAVVGVERFLAEIQVTANLQHPNLLPLFDSGEAGGLLFYVMPYVEGESLRALLDREKQLPVDDAIRIATAVAGALDYAHRHGIIHRDLKPENILLHEGQPLVADFGIALAVSNAGGNRITQTGLSLGTPQYMSPEQATGDRAIDARTDVYSLGAVTYEMLAGEAPHTGTSSQAIIARVLTEKPRSIRAGRPSVPLHVEAAVERALDKLPADRIASAREFADALTGARPVTMTPQDTPTGLATRVSTGLTRAQRAAAIAVSSVAILGAASTAYLAMRQVPLPLAGQFVAQLPDSVTPDRGVPQSVAISADGSLMAIVGEQRGERRLFIRRMESSIFTPVPGSAGGRNPSLSPDGRWLSFTVDRTLRTLNLDGATAQTVGEVSSQGPASWNSRNELLFADGSAIAVASSDGGNRRLVAAPDTSRGMAALSFPEVLPGDAYALVTITPRASANERRLGVISLSDGRITDLDLPGRAAHYVSSGHIIFARDGGLVFAAPFSLARRRVTGPAVLLFENVRMTSGSVVAFGASRNGTVAFQAALSGRSELVQVGRTGAARTLRGPVQGFIGPRASPDGKRILVQIGVSANVNMGGLWTYDLAAGTLTRLTPDSGSVRGEWTRDGSQVIYIDRANTDSERIVSRRWDGGGSAVTLVKSATPAAAWNISVGAAHGYSITRHSLSPLGDLWIAPTDSLDKARAFIATPANEVDPHISPSGTLVAYSSDESGRNEVYVTPVPGPGPRAQVSVDGGTEPVWSTEGRTLYYRTPTHLMSATVVEHPVLSVSPRRDTLFADPYSRSTTYAGYDVIPGTRDFIMLRALVERSTISVIVNWQQLSRMRASQTAK